ncbi:MAG: hypothetical protein RL215_865, partial [Planctomycetota bacterium]
FEFVGIFAVSGDTAIGSEGDADAGFVGAFEGLADGGSDGGGFGADDFGEVAGFCGFECDPFSGHVGGDPPGFVLDHELDDFVGHERAMFNGVDSSEHRAFHSFCAVSVNGDGHIAVAGGFDDGFEFFGGELGVLAAGGEAEYATGGGEFDEVGAVFVALSNGFAGIIRPIDHSFDRSRVLSIGTAKSVGGISMSAGGGE